MVLQLIFLQNMATVKWADNVIVIGGGGGGGSTVIIYNVKTQKSHWLLPMIYKRSACTAAAVDNTIIVMGGENQWTVPAIPKSGKFSK